jgi:hypothetical protein
VAFRGSKEEESEKNPYAGAAFDMLQIFEFVRSADNYNMTKTAGFLAGLGGLPKGAIEFFQPAEMMDTSLEALLAATEQLWGNMLDNTRQRVSKQITCGNPVQFPFLNAQQPGFLSKDNWLYLTAVLVNPVHVLLYRAGSGREESAVVAVSSPVLYADTYHHSSPRLLLVLSTTPTITLALCDLSQLIWTAGAVPGPIQPLSLSQKRSLEASELVQISVSQDRGLAALLLGDRTLTLLDLEDSEQ